MNLFNNHYFIALGMAKMAHEENSFMVLDYMKKYFNEEQIKEFLYEPDNPSHFFTMIREFMAEKRMIE